MDNVFEWARNLSALLGVVWLFKILRERLMAKEDTIALKEATIEQKDATIAHLEKLQAPAVVDQLEKVVGAIDRLVREKQQLEKEVQTGKDVAKDMALVSMNAGRLLGIAEGLFEAGGIIDDIVRKAVRRAAFGGAEIVIEVDEVVDKQQGIYKSLNTIASGTMPTLPHKDAFLEELRKEVQRVKDKQKEDTLLP